MTCLSPICALVPSKATSDSWRSAGASIVGHEVVIVSLVVVGVFAALSISFIQNPRGLKGPPQWKGAVSGLSLAVGGIGLYHLGPCCYRYVKRNTNAKDSLIILDLDDASPTGWEKTKAVAASVSWLAALVVTGAVAGAMLGLAGGAFSRRFRSDFEIFTKVLGGSAAAGVVGNLLLAGLSAYYKKYQKDRTLSVKEI